MKEGETLMKTKAILLVEDNPDDEELIIRILRKNHISNEIIIVRDGAEALDFIFAIGKFENRDKNNNPVLIMLDINLPKIDGLEVLKRIKTNEQTKIIPVAMLTSSDEERDLIDSYKYGANSYIRKPVDFTEFQSAVQQLALYWVLLNQTPQTSGN